jgi:guanylate kinase
MLTQEIPNVVRSISCTTRAPRAGEQNGRDYHFLTRQEFEAKIAKGDFLEYAQVYGDYYGTSREFVEKQLEEGKLVVLVIDTQGAMKLKGKIPATYIFISPPSFEILKERLIRRKTETPQLIEERLKWAKHEMEMVKHYDYCIVNDDLEVAYNTLKKIVLKN